MSQLPPAQVSLQPALPPELQAKLQCPCAQPTLALADALALVEPAAGPDVLGPVVPAGPFAVSVGFVPPALVSAELEDDVSLPGAAVESVPAAGVPDMSFDDGVELSGAPFFTVQPETTTSARHKLDAVRSAVLMASPR